MILCPPAPKTTDPATWDGLTLWASTVLLEAEGEPDEGKVAVAWVIRNRMDNQTKHVHAVILAPWQFSCWNQDAAAQRHARLTAPDPVVWERCWRAACGAAWRLIPDPTGGADHYLNETLTRQTRRDGALPSWFDPLKVTARFGRHTFLDLA